MTMPLPLPADPDLPSADLVDAVRPRRFGRIAIGTGPFNAMAMVVLAAISSFVVLSSGHVPLPHVERADAKQPTEHPRPHRSAPLGHHSPASSTTSTTSTTDAPKPAAKKTAVLASTPAKSTVHTTPHPLTCNDFTTQPSAQYWFDLNPTALAGLDGDHDGRACEQLPGAPTTTTTTTPKAPTVLKTLSKQQLLRPDTTLYGVHTAQAPLPSEVSAFAADAGKSPNMVMFFRDLDDSFPSDDIAESWSEGMLPMVTWEPIFKNSSSGQPTMGQIASGMYDDQITAWADAAAAQNITFVMRFAQEMNGNWYTWSDGLFGNHPGDYVAAWRHVHDIFTSAGATNVIWNWSVNRIDTLPNKDLSRVYPGDNYVDWVGISGYYRDASTAPTFNNTFGQTLAALHQLAPSKLVILSEVGAGTTEANRVAWINDFFTQLLNHPEIIGFDWFNDFKSGGDWEINYSSATAQAFANGVSNLRYGSLLTP